MSLLVEPAMLAGPITAGTISAPMEPRAVDLTGIGYVEEEWFASGTARALEARGHLGHRVSRCPFERAGEPLEDRP